MPELQVEKMPKAPGVLFIRVPIFEGDMVQALVGPEMGKSGKVIGVSNEGEWFVVQHCFYTWAYKHSELELVLPPEVS